MVELMPAQKWMHECFSDTLEAHAPGIYNYVLLKAVAVLWQYREIAVSVARKTDAAFWPALFEAIGAPSRILDELVDVGALDSAACCLLCVDRIEGSAAAHSRALHLIKVHCNV
jgi:hypothetical protein